MPKRMTFKLPRHIKQKYYEKTASESGIYLTWLRLLDVAPLFADYIWLQLSVFDLSQLGLGLLFDILPADFKPYSIDFRYVTPNLDELLQGIWAKFEPVDYPTEYLWTVDWEKWAEENLKPEYIEPILRMRQKAGRYGETDYGISHFDPILAREFLRATFYKLRLLRTPDLTWKEIVQQVCEFLKMAGITNDLIWNKLMLHFSAQINSFVLGLSILGRSRLPEMQGDYSIIPFIDREGRVYDIKFRTLDHLQIGFILGITPLGYGVLLPKESIYRLIEGKKNPPIIKVLMDKLMGMKYRITLSTWAYPNYNRPEEMINRHKSDKTAQYDLLQTQRRIIENWVHERIPPQERNLLRIRMYQNAVLQAVGWKAKRHKWGYDAWRHMTETDFREWWLSHWEAKGLSKATLQALYEGMEIWVEPLRNAKLRLGNKVNQARKRLALAL